MRVLGIFMAPLSKGIEEVVTQVSWETNLSVSKEEIQHTKQMDILRRLTKLVYACLKLSKLIRGHPFMTSTKNQDFDPSVHRRPREPDPPHCGRPHAVDMKYTITHHSLETASTMTFRT